jgi:putative two-component system hydrogenase maturation factor HypX/HoxX
VRILLLTHAFNGLAQRLFVELREAGHEVSVELDIHDAVTEEAIALFRPDVVLAPYLRRPIPTRVHRAVPCLVVHPGPPGDRGPSALDRAILEAASTWGVTVLEATDDLDGGPIRASRAFAMRAATKSSLYRNEVTEAAVEAVFDALHGLACGVPPAPAPRGRDGALPPLRPAVAQRERAIDWAREGTAAVLRKIRSADGSPGVLDPGLGPGVYLYDAHEEGVLRGRPGALLARRDGAVCRATADGAVWIGRMRARGEHGLKLPAEDVLGETAHRLPEAAARGPGAGEDTYREITYDEGGGVGWLRFAFHNGAMSTAQCERLRAAFARARARPTRVIVLAGGEDFWSNGIHLHAIEAAASPADESWRNIQAMDDLARDIIEAGSHLTIAALGGGAGAGGVFLALAADLVWARAGVVLNPHYKGMGNLYGSEYWTYLLPRRAGPERARAVTEARLPMGTAEALRLGLVDERLPGDPAAFEAAVRAAAARLAADPGLEARLAEKRRRRAADEAVKPLAAYRAEELERMRLNFYGFDPSYHVARYNFVFRVPKSRTPSWLARHRR